MFFGAETAKACQSGSLQEEARLKARLDDSEDSCCVSAAALGVTLPGSTETDRRGLLHRTGISSSSASTASPMLTSQMPLGLLAAGQ